MIHDAQDGGAGRTVWEIGGLGIARPVFVIAETAANALAWVRQAAEADLPAATATDRGGADRTEIALWKDETRLPPSGGAGGSAP